MALLVEAGLKRKAELTDQTEQMLLGHSPVSNSKDENGSGTHEPIRACATSCTGHPGMLVQSSYHSNA